jgi:hypothetical protein
VAVSIGIIVMVLAVGWPSKALASAWQEPEGGAR